MTTGALRPLQDPGRSSRTPAHRWASFPEQKNSQPEEIYPPLEQKPPSSLKRKHQPRREAEGGGTASADTLGAGEAAPEREPNPWGACRPRGEM